MLSQWHPQRNATGIRSAKASRNKKGRIAAAF